MHTATIKCADKRVRKTKIAQAKRRSSSKHYLNLNPNARQRKESEKSAKTAKQHSKTPEQKKATKTRALFCAQKSAKKAQTTQKKR